VPTASIVEIEEWRERPNECSRAFRGPRSQVRRNAHMACAKWPDHIDVSLAVPTQV